MDSLDFVLWIIITAHQTALVELFIYARLFF